MKIIVITKFEFRKLLNEFRLSLKEFQQIAGYFIFLITLMFIFLGLYTFLFTATEIRNYFLTTYLFQTFDEILLIIFHFLFLLVISRGVLSSNFTNFFTYSDINFFFTSPINIEELYISKYLLRSFKRGFILFISFITISPIFLYLKIKLHIIFILFFIMLFFIEISYIIS